MPANLFIGVDPLRQTEEDEDIVPAFSSNDLVPLGWYLLFSPEDVVRRKDSEQAELMPKADLSILDTRILENFRNDPIRFETTVGEAMDRLHMFKVAFSKMPYLWSYFRIIDILEKEIDKVLNPVDDVDYEELWAVKSNIRHTDKRMSQVKIRGEDKPTDIGDVLSAMDQDDALSALESFGDQFETIELEGDDPLADLEQLAEALGDNLTTSSVSSIDPDDPFAALAELEDLVPEESSPADELNEFGMSQAELLEAFSELDELEKIETEKMQEEIARTALLPSERPVIIDFSDLVTDLQDIGKGENFYQVLDYFDRLLHHVNREDHRTRIILEIMQDIFRLGGTGWRPTGQISEDFMREQINTLSLKMIGEPSPYAVIDQTFDLEYWTKNTLQRGDERIMYKLSMFPSEEIHHAVKNGKLSSIISQIRPLLTATNLVRRPKITPKLLRIPPSENNLWGFRVIIKDTQGEFRAASLLNTDTDLSWEEEFKRDLQLPSVRQDWHIELTLRLDDFLDEEPYVLEFKGAKNEDEAFVAFVRWIRVGMRLYEQRFGTEGTIKMLSEQLINATDQAVAMEIFDILNQLADYGFSMATEVLSDTQILDRIAELYST